jgi:predicted Fe-S protein YdhL (DUF1289 family)
MLDEIVGWGRASSKQKKEILIACSHRKKKTNDADNH